MAGGYQDCPDCKRKTEAIVDSITGECMCTECGLVLDTNNVDETHDVRIFEGNQEAQRIELAGPLDKGGLAATNIAGSGSGALVRTARKSVNSSKEGRVREHQEAMGELAFRLHVSKPVIERASYIFNEFCNSSKCPFRGKDKKKMDAILVSCLYHAGKQLSQQKPIDEWAEATDMTLRDIFQAGKIIQPFISAENAYYLSNPKPMRVEGDQRLKASVSRLCRLLGFEFSERIIAEEMAAEVVKTVTLRRKPASTAGVIVWICSLLHGRDDDLMLLSKKSVSLKILRQTYIELYPHLEGLVPTSKFGELKNWFNKLRSP